MTVSRSGNGGPDSLVVSGLFIYDVLWSRPVRAPYQLSDVRAVSRLVHTSPSGILHLVSIDSLAQPNYLSRPKGVKTRPNDPSAATRRTGHVDCNPDKQHRDLADSTDSAMAGFAAAHG